MIKDRDFINIEDKYFGGSSEIFKEIETRDFSRIEPSGFLCLNDLLLYEFRKFSDELGTFPGNKYTIEEYTKLLRNHIIYKAYRFMGFVSVDSIETYIKKFSEDRRIKISTYVKRDFASRQIFENYIIKFLEKDHPLILQKKSRNNLNLPKYIMILGHSEDYLLCSVNGEKRNIKISDIYDFEDREIGLFTLEIIYEKN